MRPLVSQAFRTLVLVFNQSRQDSAQFPSLPPVLFLSRKAQYVVVSSATLTCSNHFSHCLYEDMYGIMYGTKVHERSSSKEESTATHNLGVQSTMVVRAWKPLVTPHPQPGGRER